MQTGRGRNRPGSRLEIGEPVGSACVLTANAEVSDGGGQRTPESANERRPPPFAPPKSYVPPDSPLSPGHQEESNARAEKHRAEGCGKPEAGDPAAHVEIRPVTRGEPSDVQHKV